MKSSLLIKSAAVVAVLGAAVSAHASLGYVPGDLVLGFQNASKSVEFSIGGTGTTDLASLTAQNGATFDLGNINAGLSNSTTSSGFTGTGFGSTWNSDGTVSWGVAAVNGSSFITGMQQGITPVVPGDTPTAIGALGSIVNGGLNSNSPLSKIGVGGVQVAATQANSSLSSWNAIDKNLATAGAFGTYANASLVNTLTTATTVGTSGALNGLTYSALDLYQATGAAGSVSEQLLGTLALTTGGEVFFTSAIPEPSTYAMILGAAALGFVMLRRRQQVAA